MKYKILATIYFFTFWAFTIIEQELQGKYQGDLSVVIAFIWFIPSILLAIRD
jgi:hypothetical protein